MVKKNDLCERLLKFAIDVILYLRTVKNSLETMDRANVQWTFEPACVQAQLISANKKTMKISSGSLENVKNKAFEALKIREFTFVNDCFQDKSNAVIGVF